VCDHFHFIFLSIGWVGKMFIVLHSIIEMLIRMFKIEFAHEAAWRAHTKLTGFTPKMCASLVFCVKLIKVVVFVRYLSDLFFFWQNKCASFASSYAFHTVDPKIVHVCLQMCGIGKSLSLSWDNNDPVAAEYSRRKLTSVFSCFMSRRRFDNSANRMKSHITEHVCRMHELKRIDVVWRVSIYVSCSKQSLLKRTNF